MSFEERTHMWKVAGRYSALGIEIGVAVAMGAWGGSWLEQRYGFAPWGVVFGLIIGIGAAISSAYRAVKQARRDL
jgi:F0F1-type ATP synthase assembly protein I